MGLLQKTERQLRNYRELAKDGLVDLHSHILPGLDDGAASLEESLELLYGLAKLGFTQVVATPHFDVGALFPTVDEQDRHIARIEDAPKMGSIPKVLSGAEIMLDERAVSGLTHGHFPGLADSQAYLVEFGFRPGGVPIHAEEVVFKMRTKGILLLLAHPERCADLRDNPARVESLRSVGMCMQLDVMSLTGRHGSSANKMARHMLELRQFDVASTDIHAKKDLPLVNDALGEMAYLFPDDFERMVSINPSKIVAGRFEEMVFAT